MALQYIPQNFPFCYSLMSHINAGRTATIQAKLIQTCKYCFVKNPIVVVDDASFFNENVVELEYKKKWIKFDPKAMPIKLKLWITTVLEFSQVQNWQLCLSKIYQFEKVRLVFCKLTILISDLKIFAEKSNGNLSQLVLVETNVIESDGSEVSIDEITKVFPGAEKYHL